MCFLFASRSAVSSGVSIPTNTAVKPASLIWPRRSSSSARFTDAWVKNGIPGFPRFHSTRAGSRSFFTCRRLPIRLSSAKKTGPRQPISYSPSSSAMTCPADLIRGRRPNRAVTLQKSHPYGQPREYWTDIEA